MNSKERLFYFIAKSTIRIIACILSIISEDVMILAIGLIFAESLEIVEKIVDKRW